MKITKNQVSNLALLVFIGVFMFTPIGTTIKIWVNKAIAFSPSVIKEEKRRELKTYEWKLRNIQNEKELLDFSKVEGKVVLINFWATWCPPCIAEMPSLQSLYDDYQEEVVFLFVTFEDVEKVEPFLTKRQYNFPVYQPVTKIPRKLRSRSIPATYLIDKEGKIVIDKKGPADWNSSKVRKQIDELLSK
ncbi:TlpA disulfide reductase family protein [Leptobacterium sp. I13]|uniref:TlpA family protein disulfide reductase n=1 Tax=Leptobacterium meishanense TaxID=3128904 RepID=UPI0030EE1CED